MEFYITTGHIIILLGYIVLFALPVSLIIGRTFQKIKKVE